MSVLRTVLDRAVLVAAVLCAGMAPSFMAQYRQRVGGHLAQALQDLAPFQQIANLRHRGSLEALVQHHLQSSDPTFQAEGAAIRAMMESVQRLKEAVEGLSGTLAHQLLYLLQHPDPDLARATWAIYQPSFAMSMEGLVFALSAGLLIWLVFLGIWWLVARTRRAAALPHRRARSIYK
jgi:sensor c-di-GMP phosphodiesterase-like protein